MTVQKRLEENLAAVEGRIEAACARAARPRSGVRLVAVTKGRDATAVAGLIALGQPLLGENRVQEAIARLPAPGAPGRPEIHLIGHLQTNKASAAAAFFDRIHSVDSPRLAAALSRAIAPGDGAGAPPPPPLGVLVQVNTSREASKHGCAPAELESLLESVARLPGLRLEGLMTMATGGDLAGDTGAARACFRMLSGLADRHRLRFADPDRVELSMGMSGDFEVAIEEGATLVRVGSALFEGVAPTTVAREAGG